MTSVTVVDLCDVLGGISAIDVMASADFLAKPRRYIKDGKKKRKKNIEKFSSLLFCCKSSFLSCRTV